MHRYGHLVVAAMSCGVSFGCNSSSEPASAAPGGAYEALANQLKNCGSGALDCLKAANCDETKERACRDDFDTCRNDNGALLRAFQRSVQDCADTRKECVAAARGAAGSAAVAGATSAAGSGGAHASRHEGQRMLRLHQVEACRDDFAMCIEDHEPSPPPAGPCMQGFRSCIQAGDQSAHECVSAARSCFLNRLPMCRPGAAGASGTAGSGASAR